AQHRRPGEWCPPRHRRPGAEATRVAADGRRSVPGVNETRPRRSSGREAGSESLEDPLDDWLGNVSDDDWDEGATPPARSPSSPYQQAPAPQGERAVAPASR